MMNRPAQSLNRILPAAGHVSGWLGKRANKPPPDPVLTPSISVSTEPSTHNQQNTATQKEKIMKRRLFHHLAIPVIGIALTLLITSTSAFAVTAAGTTITNTASVTWTGATSVVTDTADITVLLKATPPNVAYVSTSPSTSVGANTDVTITYTVTSTANGSDSYTLDLTSVQSSTDLSAPTFAGANPVLASDLGASMALNNVTASDTVVIPGVAADHGLAVGETVIIGGTPYTINTAVAAAGNTTLTLYDFGTTNTASVTMTAGDPIYEQVTLTFDVTTGLFVSGTTDQTHTLTLDATSVADNTQTGSVTDPTINVLRATLTMTKVANPATAQPGGTITYTITVFNANGNPTAANVTVTDSVPAFTTYVTNSTTLNGAPVGTPDGGVLPLAAGLNIGNLAGNTSAVITFQVTVD